MSLATNTKALIVLENNVNLSIAKFKTIESYFFNTPMSAHNYIHCVTFGHSINKAAVRIIQ